jgi:uncharacterized protein YdhG (YjbR/CyaY superfamily)
MVQSAATTVADYLAELPAERRAVIAKVRAVIRRNLPKGYRETMNWGMITYEVPLQRLPDTYNGQPLCYASLAAQKNYNALYLMTVYGNRKQEQALRDAFKKEGKKLDMGKSCVRFKSADQLPLEAIGRIIAAVPLDKYVAAYEKSRKR